MAENIKVGDKVFFKNDVEGTGQVVEIVQRGRGYYSYKEYVIANMVKDASPWHIMARFNHKHMCNTVTCDEDHVEPL